MTHQEYDLVEDIHGLLGGLIQQAQQPPTVGLQSGWVSQGGPPSCDNAIVPTHCMRTVSQRSLSTPVTFLSAPVHSTSGQDIFDALVTNAVTGALPGVGTGGTAPIVFNDADVQAQRQRIDDLVLIGARAKVAVQAQSGDGGAVTPFNIGRYPEAIAEFVRQYVVWRAYATSDANESWVDSTPLAYFDRPDGEFLPVPPVVWKDRDPRMELDVRVADFGAGAGLLPTLQVLGIEMDLQLSILFETLWIPNPDYCGQFWPGEICPKTHVKNAPGYTGK